jgi:very-short-patch-repair endonuclease
MIKYEYTTQELLDELKRVYIVIGMPISQKSFSEHSDIPFYVIDNRIGWGKACTMAGVISGGTARGRVRIYIENLVRKEITSLFGNIEIEVEKSFKDLINPKTGGRLKYDFYIPAQKLAIEVDGWTHYNVKAYKRIFDGSVKDVQERDKIKNQYAIDHNFTLLRIPQEKLSRAYLKSLLNSYVRSINAENCLETQNLESYNVTGNSKRDMLENLENSTECLHGTVGNQQPSPCIEKLGKVQRPDLTLNSITEHEDNSRQHGDAEDEILFIFEKAMIDVPKEKMIELYTNQLLSDQKIADKFGYDYSIIYRIRTERYGIPSRSVKFQTTQKMDVEKLHTCLAKKLTYDQMENELGMSRGIIHRWIKRTRTESVQTYC